MRVTTLLIACIYLTMFLACTDRQPKSSNGISPSDEIVMENALVDEKLSENSERRAEELQSLISAEIAAVPNHAWAGSYYKGDGRGENVSFIIAPTNGYLFEWHGCLGLYDRNYGNIELQAERLRLTFAYPNTRGGFQGIAEELLPVSWGDRIYLIPSDEIVGFCNDINSGKEPRRRIYGQYLLRDGDETKAVQGQPEIPIEFRRYLLDKPITAVITGIGNVTKRPSVCEWYFKDTEVVLGGGIKDGILLGMEFYVVTPDDVVESLTIQSVDEARSIGVVTQIDENASPIKPGWEVSTRPRWSQ